MEAGEIEVLIYNGNLDVIVHLSGTNALVRSLNFSRRHEFDSSKRKLFWVLNEDNGEGELAGHLLEGGGLTYLVVRNAGHMVPISQPRWAREMAKQFTRRSGQRWSKPEEIKERQFSALKDC